VEWKQVTFKGEELSSEKHEGEGEDAGEPGSEVETGEEGRWGREGEETGEEGMEEC